MFRKVVAVWVSLAMLLGFVVIVDVVTDITPPVKAATITVDDSGGADYFTIQEGIDAANPGDTVYVYNGIYNENLVINKRMILSGEDKNSTIINGLGSGTTISISVSWVNLTGFYITNSGSSTNDAGVRLNGVSYCNISECNIIFNKHYGVWITTCSYLNINNCFIETNEMGIYMSQSHNLTIQNNTIWNCTGKVGSNGSTGTYGSEGGGIYISQGMTINISNNSIYSIYGGKGGDSTGSNIAGRWGSNGYGLYLSGSGSIHFLYNSIYNINAGIGGNSGWLKDGARGGYGYGISLINTHNSLFIGSSVGEINGGIGGNATDLADGGEGGRSYGIYFKNSDDNRLKSNILSGVIGGNGGYDSTGEHNGNGGPAYGFYFDTSSRNTIIDSLIENITGHDGGSCTSFGGRGGNSVGIGTYGPSGEQYVNKDNVFISNKIINVRGGQGGDSGGYGAKAGNGGHADGLSWVTFNGSTMSHFVINNVRGGDGGTGGTGGAGGTGGNGGDATGIEIWRDFGHNTTISNTSICDIANGIKGLGQDGAPNGIDGIAQGLRNTDYEVNFINGSIENVSGYDLYLVSGNMEIINSSFNKSKTNVEGSKSNITVKWFVHITVLDTNLIPVPDVKIRIHDNENGTYDENYTTKNDGSVRWILCTEYYQTSSTKVFFTPHNITATNDFYEGFAQPEPIIDCYRVIIFSIQKPFLNLSQGWNLISIPLIQDNQDISKVLEMIDGYYDAVQWYNITVTVDPWKHHKVGKSFGNDLFTLNETIGFWIHITNPGDTIFLYNGTQPSVNQSITLHPGWNMVGYPSLSNRNRTVALNNINYGNDVDAIWTFDAATQTWQEIGPTDHFELGRGYWIHSKVTKVWDVPL